MNLPQLRRNCLVFNVLLLLGGAGCSTLPAPGPVDGGFHLRGKLGVVQHDESFSARFLWQQQRSAFTIDLWGPLGQGRVRLTGDDDYLELRDGDGAIIDRGRAESVMRRHLGWSLPLAVLPQWVRGRPAPRLPVSGRSFDEAGRLSAFDQLDWHVELARYRQVAGVPAEGVPVAGSGGAAHSPAGIFLPHLLTAHRGAYRVRLAVSDWQF